MTNEQYLKSMKCEAFAEYLIYSYESPIYDYDWDDNLVECGSETMWVTSDGEEFGFDDKESALEHECEWLRSERNDQIEENGT